MCGIYLRLGGKADFDDSAMEVIRRRGPNAHGLFNIPNGVIGHSRLSILDLDPRSDQPMKRGSVVISFNGEIYNFRALKMTLKGAGYEFTTNSDTEVIINAYLHWGKDFVLHLNGMFAIIIYDERVNKIHFARDRFGQKPVYYGFNGDGIIIGSDLRQIPKKIRGEVSDNSVVEFLKYKYVRGNETIFSNIFRLTPGNIATFDIETRGLQIEQYYCLQNRAEKSVQPPDLQELGNELQRSVQKRMVADVPLGVFLSGGIDSSLVAYYASKISESKLQTFSIGFDNKDFDESIFAERVARKLNTNHSTFLLTAEKVSDEIEDFVLAYDEPFADSSALATMALCKHTSASVTVALSGDGADEFFLGYNRYLKSRYRSKHLITKMPIFSKHLIPQHPRTSLIKRLIGAENEIYAYDLSIQDSKVFEVLNEESTYDKLPEVKSRYDLDIFTYLPYDINYKIDRASMYHSLEVRSPFLDHDLVEFSRKYSLADLTNKENGKLPLRELAYKLLGRELMERPKSGFSVPIGQWIRTKWSDQFYDFVTDDFLNGLLVLDVSRTKDMIQRHMDGEKDYSSFMWKLMVLAIWKVKNV